ncbi:MAG: biotin-dependent carboxyltransferase family protein [Clostridiales bacterium]|jgi:biotin-dependent carboxylase-like uncharacterized protein|nr:biotin-dependent carboxyltransferase family protein [Clostridiales bacterium]
MGIVLTNAGPISTIQDGGRAGYMAFGFQESGAMDKKAFNTANILVKNPRDEAAIEMTLMGISGEFTSDAVIAFTGADIQPKINGESAPRYQAVKARKGDVLTTSFATTGCRAYLAVHGGFYLKKVMDSYSTNVKCKIGGYMGRPLLNGDLLYFNTVEPKLSDEEISMRRADIPECVASPVLVRVLLGLQEDYFTKKGIETFFSSEYKVTNDSDRMGIKLDGEGIESKNGVDIISDGIPLGAVQIPASGKPIIMMADRQTVGGYAKIGAVVSADICVMAQLKPGDSLRFVQVTLKEAKDSYIKRLNELDELERKVEKKKGFLWRK